MHDMLYIVKYTGKFGFIRPVNCDKNDEIYSQDFLVSSHLIGIRDKLKTGNIRRHLLNANDGFCVETNETNSIQFPFHSIKFLNLPMDREKSKMSILRVGKLINPTLWLAFSKEEDMLKAKTQSIHLTDSENMIFPTEYFNMSEYEFNKFQDETGGKEFIETFDDNDLLFGYNRYSKNKRTNKFDRIYGIINEYKK